MTFGLFRAGNAIGKNITTLLLTLGLALSVHPTRAMAQSPTPGLAAAYGLNEGTGGTVADASGNANTGAISGATWTTGGKFSNALSFNGTNSRVTVANSPSLQSPSTAVTVSAWIRPDGNSEEWSSIVQKVHAPNFVSYALGQNANSARRLSGYLQVNGTVYTTAVSRALSNQTWYFVALTWQSGQRVTLTIYNSNGSVFQTVTTTQAPSGTINYDASPLLIGEDEAGDNWKGTIDEVRVYSRALTTSEIQSAMNTPISPPPPPQPDTTPPTVSITAPAAGATVTGAVTVSAAAADNVGVSGVQFLLNGAPLGVEDTTAPYAVSWDTASAPIGPNTLSARARDAAGNTALAADVTVSVSSAPPPPDTTPPTVSITAPAAGATVTGAVTVSAAAADNVGVSGVQFLLNGAPLGAEDTTAPYEVLWDTASAPIGPNTLSARARDAAGNTALAANVTVSVSSSPPPQPGGLVAAYAFEEGAGGSAVDASGNNNTATLQGATWTTQGKYGNALTFNGSSTATVNDASSLDLTTGMTLEAWVYPTATPTNWSTALMKEQSGGMTYTLYAGSPANRPELYIFTSGDQGITGPSALPLSTWTHLAGTYDGTTLRLYVNGTQVANKAVSGSIISSSGPLRMGGNGIWPEYFQGRIDEVRLYNRALTASEIQTDMNTPIGGTPLPPPDVAQVGRWDGPFAWPLVAVHMTLLRTGEVLMWDGQSNGYDARLWNPISNTFTAVPSSDNIFCAGHAALADGRILVAGGHAGFHTGIGEANIFDPAGDSWAAAASMSDARWYPTATTLPDGRILVTVGETNCSGCIVDIPEIYNPSTNTWTRLTNARLALPYYPHMFVLPDGRVLAASTAEASIPSYVLDVNAQSWAVVAPTAVDGGSAAMYRPGKVIKAGKSVNPDQQATPSVASTYVLDMTQGSPVAWRQTAPMAFPRTYHYMTLLPDGNVLVTGGGTTTGALDLGGAVFEAELWSPATETWKTMAKMQTPRLYHSTALLLPDGRVLSAGGGRYDDFPEPTDQLSAEIYSPPYLFKGTRPTITSAPAAIQYGASFSVATPNASGIAMVSLVRLGSVTHAFDFDQRFLALGYQAVSGGLTVQAPANANLAPPGYYMLFIVDANGVPSVAAIVRLT